MMNMNSNMDAVNNLNELESFNPSFHELISLSNEGFYDQQRSQLPFPFSNELQNASNIPHVTLNYDSVACFFPPPGGHGCGNMNAVSESDCLVNSSPQVSKTGLLGNNKAVNGNYNHSRKKRKRKDSREVEKPREVVHVRAKRGQATDSHSIAERLRREKINEKLRCLQDLVPGCYKTMGMAVMLDVIINYVRSLQNQIDFLSMKLSAASLFYDFNSSEMDTIGTIQGTNGFEAQGMEKLMGKGYGMLPQFHPSWPL